MEEDAEQHGPFPAKTIGAVIGDFSETVEINQYRKIIAAAKIMVG